MLLKDDNLPRNQWQLSCVVEAEVDSDGLVLTVTIGVADRILNQLGQRVKPASMLGRSIQKLVLPVACETSWRTRDPDRGTNCFNRMCYYIGTWSEHCIEHWNVNQLEVQFIYNFELAAIAPKVKYRLKTHKKSFALKKRCTASPIWLPQRSAYVTILYISIYKLAG